MPKNGHLVLGRERDQVIRIGDDIKVTVHDIRGDKVRLGITAPPDVTIHREEVYQAIQHERRAVRNARPVDLPSASGQVARRR